MTDARPTSALPTLDEFLTVAADSLHIRLVADDLDVAIKLRLALMVCELRSVALAIGGRR